MHTICKYCRTGTHFVGQGLRFFLIQQQNSSNLSSYVLRFYICVMESRIQIHPINGQQNWRTYGTNTDLSNKPIWLLEKCNIFGSYYQVLKTRDGQNPESLDERIILMSLFNDIEWTKKGNTEICLHNAEEVAAFATQFKPGHWCFLGPASENT